MKDKKRSYYKELKQPDEFVTFWNRVVTFVQEHRREFLYGAAALLLLVVLTGSVTLYLQSRERKAAALFAGARATLDAASTAAPSPIDGQAPPPEQDATALQVEAVSELEAIASRYGRTPAGQQSLLLLGQIAYREGDHEAARRFYEALADRRGVSAELRTLAWEGLAYVHEEAGNLDRAAAYYEKIAKGKISYLQPWAWMGLARCYESMGDPERALEAYNRFLSDFPHHTLAPEARALVSRILTRTLEEPATTAEPSAGPTGGEEDAVRHPDDSAGG